MSQTTSESDGEAALLSLVERMRQAWEDIDCGLIASEELRDVLVRLGCEEDVDADELWEQLAEDGVIEIDQQ